MLPPHFLRVVENSPSSQESPDTLRWDLTFASYSTFFLCIPQTQPTEISDPTTIIAQFKQAAMNAKEAVFDGVECELLPAAALIKF
jgi:2,4-dienoyl-CoA reductase-like NADH-dependent reductase (Old Yellow Enzyme family)